MSHQRRGGKNGGCSRKHCKGNGQVDSISEEGGDKEESEIELGEGDGGKAAGINVCVSVCVSVRWCVCFSLAIPAALPHSIYSSGKGRMCACVCV